MRTLTPSDLVAASVGAKLFPSLAAPARFGRFELRGLLGRGGMGSVYRAFDPTLQRDVALKLAHTRPGGARWSATSEARAMARLMHPNVVAVHEIDCVGSQPFVVMELVQGVPLHAWLQQRRRSIREIVRVFVGAAQGLQAAHDVGIVHRDFKPENTLVTAEGAVKVADFGLACAAQRPGARGGHRVDGTPRYMSPEQRAGLALDARSDQFSLCASLYEAVTGQQFSRSARSWTRTGERIPRSLRRAVERGLQTNPERRWPSLAALIKQLQPRTRAPLAVVGVGVATLIAAAIPTSAAPCSTTMPGPQWGERSEAELRTQLLDASIAPPRSTFIADRFASWAADWRLAVDDVCEVKPLAERVMRASCLETLSLEFDALRIHAASLATRGEGDVVAALPAAWEIEACRSGAPAQLAVRLPLEPRTAARVRAVRRQLARARHADLPPAARRAEFDALAQEVHALDFAPLRAELSIARARWHRLQGSSPEAYVEFERAYHASVAGDDHSRAATAAMGCATLAGPAGHHEGAPFWLASAATHVAHPVARPGLMAELHVARGLVALGDGDVDAALVEYEIAEDLGGEATSDALAGLAEVYTRLGQAQLAQTAVTTALEIAAPGSVAELRGHTNAAATFGTTGDVVAAQLHLERAADIARVRLSPRSDAWVHLEIDRGNVALARDPWAAERYFLSARTRLVRTGRAGWMAGLIDYQLALAKFGQGDMDAAQRLWSGAREALPRPVRARLGIDACIAEAASLAAAA